MLRYRTYGEYIRTPEFRILRRFVLKRAAGQCVDCGRNATQVHHVRYCKWGDIDAPENLVAICFRCHEDRHRCVECGEVRLKAREIKMGLITCPRCMETAKCIP